MTLLIAIVAGACGFAVAGLAALGAGRQLDRRSSVALGMVAGGFAIVAAFAPGTPTRLAPFDVVLRMAVAAVCVAAASYAPPIAVLASATLAAAASDHSSLQPLALAALGAMIALVLIRRKAPVAQAVVAGAVAVVVLHLAWPRTTLAPSVAAAVVVAPLLVAGFLAAPTRSRRPARRAVVALAAVVVVFSCLGLVGALLARSHLRHGVDAARQALAAIRAGDRDAAAAQFRQASADFEDANSTVGSVWVAPALAVPGLSPQIRAIRVAAATGAELGRIGADTARAADVSTVHVVDGKVPVDALSALKPPLQRALDSLTRADAAISAARSPWLVPPVANPTADLLTKLQGAGSDARLASDAAAVVPAFLGEGGPRRYFLAMQNPSESRAVGGIIGNFGEITADHGALALTRVGRVYDLNTAGVSPTQRALVADPDYVARYAGQTPTQFWENVTLSPDFPSVAGVVRTLYPQSGGTAIDGVISVTPAGLAALLRVIGPVNVAEWPSPLSADNVEQVLEYDQYTAFRDKSQRLDFLATATATIWKRLTAASLPSAKDLVSAVAPAVRSKDIILASFHPDEQALFDVAGVSARMAPVHGDYLGVVTQNAGGSKLDWFMRRKIDYHVAIDGRTGALKATLKIALHNKAPLSGLPPYVVNGDNPLTLPEGDNRTYLSVYTPWSFTSATVDGHPVALQSERELGRNVLSDYLDVMPGADVTIEIELAGRLADAKQYRLDVYHQPTIASDQVNTSLSLEMPARIKSAPGWTQTSPSAATKHFDSTSDSTLQATLTR